MKLKKIVMALLILVVGASLFGCTVDKEKVKKTNTTKYSEVYTLALDSLISLDETLNYEMDYIALDTKSFTNATEEDMKVIMENLKKYEVDVIEESLESLQEKKMLDEYGVLYGILLKIENVDVKSKNKIVIESSKYRSGLGAIWIETTIVKKDNVWEVEKSEIGAIS